MVAKARGRRFLVFPCHVENSHWVLAIADRTSGRIYWFNSSQAYAIRHVQKTLAKYLVNEKLFDKEPEYEVVGCLEQPDEWECGLLVLEHVRTFFREPSLRDTAGIHHWGESCLFNHSVPLFGTDWTPARKLAWVRTNWIGCIRAELGHRSFNDVRYPLSPRCTFGNAQDTDMEFPNDFPPNWVGNGDDRAVTLAGTVAEFLADSPDYTGAATRMSGTELRVNFDTWISGEGGWFLSNGNLREYPYTRYRSAPKEVPDKYKTPIKITGVDDEATEREDAASAGSDDGFMSGPLVFSTPAKDKQASVQESPQSDRATATQGAQTDGRTPGSSARRSIGQDARALMPPPQTPTQRGALAGTAARESGSSPVTPGSTKRAAAAAAAGRIAMIAKRLSKTSLRDTGDEDDEDFTQNDDALDLESERPTLRASPLRVSASVTAPAAPVARGRTGVSSSQSCRPSTMPGCATLSRTRVPRGDGPVERLAGL